MSDRRALLSRGAPLLLLLAMALALLLRADAGLELTNSDETASTGLTDALERLPDDALVLVGFDPDIGTYAEIRPTVRTLLADLMDRDATLALVSLTPEGRALAVAELARLERNDANPRQLVDLGFLPGAEAAVVSVARALESGAADGVISGLPGATDLSAVALVLVIGGNDLGPRTWVEQAQPRTDGIELVAVAPSVLLPELQPYVGSGQLGALVATPRDGAAYRATVDLGTLDRLAEGPERAALPLLVGALAAVAVLGQAVGTRIVRGLRAGRAREAA